MTTKKIFSITGREVSTTKGKNLKLNSRRRARSSMASNTIYWNGLHVITIIAACGLAMSITTMIPRHNSILEQEYWYEVLIPAGFGSFIRTAAMILDLIVFTDIENFKSIKFFMKVSLACSVTMIGSYCFCYTFWSKVSGYNHPMPFVGFVCRLISIIVSTVSLRLFAPAEVMTKTENRGKLRNHIIFVFVWTAIMFIQLIILNTIFRQLKNSDAQCITAILIQVFKICSKRLFSKLVHRIARVENERSNVALTVAINIYFGMFLATRLVEARSATVSCMIVVELMMQLEMTYRITRLHQKVAVNECEKDNKISFSAVSSLLLLTGVIFIVYISPTNLANLCSIKRLPKESGSPY